MKTQSFIFIFLFALSACSHQIKHAERTPASPGATGPGCRKLMSRFIEPGYQKNIKRAVEEKNLVHRSLNRITVRKPRPSLFTRLYKKAERFFSRVINDNRYPAYYIFDEEETVPKVMAYVRSYVKKGSRESTEEAREQAGKRVDDVGEEQTKNAVDDFGPQIQSWLSDYGNYDKQIDDLIKTRVSLAYNHNLLKQYKSEAEDIERVKLHFYKDGKFEESVFTFRQEDDNLNILIRDIDNEIDRFDGGWFTSDARENSRLGFNFVTEGVIRNRVLEQAKLRDRLVILHREVEFVFHNLGKRSEFDGYTEEGERALEELYVRVSNMLAEQDARPSNWAVKKTSRQKFLREFQQSIKSNRRLKELREKSQVMSDYLSEKEISRAQLLNRGMGFFTRSAFFATPGVVTLSGLVTMFDLDEDIVNLYEKYLVWRYGNKIQCVRETLDSKYIDCLYKHYESEYPEIIQFAYKDPDFNPWDFEAIRAQGDIAEAVVDAYVSDIEEMQKFREYYRYIQKRKVEIKELFAEQHQIIIDGVVPRPDNLAACVAIEQDELPLCVFDTIFSRLSADAGKLDVDFERQNFPYDQLDEIPEEIREQYKNELEEVLYQRSIYRDLNELDDYQLRIFFDE